MKVNFTRGLLCFILSSCLVGPFFLHAQPIISEKKIVDSVTFTSFKKGDSSFTNFISPNANVTHRQVGKYSATSLNQAGKYRVLVQKDSATLSKIKLDTNGVFLNVGDTGIGSASLTLTKGNAEIKAKQIWFNGDWIRVPVVSNYQLSNIQPPPQGSLFYSQKTKGVMVSNGVSAGPAYWEYPDGNDINPTVMLTSWNQQNADKTPAIRIRHPLNVSNKNLGNVSRERDFTIIPYQYGIAIDYNGLVECWVGEFSIHRGLNYNVNSENNNHGGWGGILWVGDDYDLGGLRATARNEGPLLYSEISSEKFYGASHGPLRLRTIDSSDQFQFVNGGRGSNKQILYLERKADTSVIGTGQQLNLAIKTNSLTRLLVDKTGNVGIGTTVPQSLLDLKGNAGYSQLGLRTPYTPTSTSDPHGNPGEVSWDDNYIYIKTSGGWKRTKLEVF